MLVSCPDCGARIEAEAPDGRCGRCLLALGLAAARPEPEPQTIDLSSLLAQPVGPLGVKCHTFGDYELLEELARGAMGVVFRARQSSLNRIVALKLIAAGRLASSEQVRRFRAEAETAASLDHSHIVPIYEIGEHGGQHYFTMKLMEGGSLAAKLSNPNTRVSHQDAAKLVACTARAIHFAHQRGVLHRDLKPGNILLDARGEAHVTDFGLAKVLTEGADLKQTVAVLGTPSYMSPEQARGQIGGLTTASDVYSLGAILYELLSGRPPFVGDNLIEVLRCVAEEDPIPPSLAAGASPLDHDLETICLKCLNKEPVQRYSSAAGLGADLERWLEHKPIMARPPTTGERLVKWTRRNPALASMAVLLLVVVTLGLASVLTQWQRARVGELKAQTNAQAWRRQLYAANVNLAHQAWNEGNLPRARALMATVERDADKEDLGGFVWRYLRRLCERDESQHTVSAMAGRVTAVAFWDQDRLLVGTTNDLRLTDVRGGLLEVLLTETNVIQRVCRSPAATNLLAIGTGKHEIVLWDLATRRRLGTLTSHTGAINALAFSADGHWLASAGDYRALLWSLPDLTLSPQQVQFYREGAYDLAFSRDSKRLATCGRHSAVHFWDLTLRRTLPVSLQGHSAFVESIEVSPDGRSLASAGGDGRIIMWDLASGQTKGSPIQQFGRILSLAFSPDGRQLASGSWDNTLRLWDTAEGRMLAMLRGHVREPECISFSPDGRLLASVDAAGVAKIWDLTSVNTCNLVGFHPKWVNDLAFSPDGALLASVGYVEPLGKLWDIRSRREIATLRGHTEPIAAVAFSRQGRWLATGSHDKTVRLWNPTNGQPVDVLSHDFPVLAFDFSPDERKLAVCGNAVYSDHGPVKPALWIWDLGSGRHETIRENLDLVWQLAFDPLGRSLALGFRDGTVRLWDFASGRLLPGWREHSGAILCLAFSADGGLLASGSMDGTVVLYDPAGQTPAVGVLRGHTDWVYTLAFAPDGRTLASTASDGTPRLWNLPTREVALTLNDPDGPVTSVAFSDDGESLATGGASGAIRLWTAAPLPPRNTSAGPGKAP